MVELGRDAAGLERSLHMEFPQAQLERVDAGRDEFLAPRVRAVADVLAGKQAHVDVDLLGTAFQKKVWDALMRIPRGETRSYSALAADVGAPQRRARDRERLRTQPHRDPRPVPSRRPQRRLARRIPLGPAAQGATAAARTRGVAASPVSGGPGGLGFFALCATAAASANATPT